MSKNSEASKRVPSKEDILNEHIAKTYFRQKDPPQPLPLPPLPSGKKPKRKPFILSFILIVAIIAISIPVFNITRARYVKHLSEKVSRSPVLNLFDKGRLDRTLVSRVEFSGYANGRCKFSDAGLTLNSLKKYNWADASFDFEIPFDLTDRNLSITTKGVMGGEKLSIAVRDRFNRTYKLRDLYLTSNWKTDTISFNTIRKDIDITGITHIRFEYGRVGEAPKLMDSLIDITIFIKSIQITREAK